MQYIITLNMYETEKQSTDGVTSDFFITDIYQEPERDQYLNVLT